MCLPPGDIWIKRKCAYACLVRLRHCHAPSKYHGDFRLTLFIQASRNDFKNFFTLGKCLHSICLLDDCKKYDDNNLNNFYQVSITNQIPFKIRIYSNLQISLQPSSAPAKIINTTHGTSHITITITPAKITKSYFTMQIPATGK